MIKDPDIEKMNQIESCLEVMDVHNFYNSREINQEIKDLLVEYHNAIALGLCPNFVVTLKERMNAKVGESSNLDNS